MKKTLTLTLLSLVLGAGLTLLPAGAVAFSDTIGHSAEAAIDEFASLGILQGYGDGTFGPDVSITRGDMCTILSRVFTYTETTENTFTDLDESLWYAQPMLQLNAAGVIRGYGDGTIKPLNTITWEEALVMIARAFSIPVPTEPVALPYEDQGQISEWALESVTALYAGGYLHGESLLGPQEPFTRGDAVVVMDSIVSHKGWEIAGKTVVDGVLVPLSQVTPPDGSAGGEEESAGSGNPDDTAQGGSGTASDPNDADGDGLIDTEGHNYPYDPNNFVAVDGRIYYLGKEITPTYGIDVSTHQGKIDWQAVAADGIEFAIIRLGYRGYGAAGTLNMDARFVENIEGALAAGLKVGVYFFSQAITVEEAIEEANFVLTALEPYRSQITLPVVFDWEDIGTTSARTYKLDNAILNACALAFCGQIQAAGYHPMIYFYPNLGAKRYDLDLISQYPFWYCYYNGTYPNLERPFRIWQYSSTGRVAGIEGDVDLNICFWPY